MRRKKITPVDPTPEVSSVETTKVVTKTPSPEVVTSSEVTETAPIAPVKSSDTSVVTVKKSRRHFPWQRLTLSVLGVAIIVTVWQLAVYNLYSLPDHSIAAFSSITSSALYVIGALVVFFVTGHLVYEWNNSTSSSLSETAQHVAQNIVNKDILHHDNPNK